MDDEFDDCGGTCDNLLTTKNSHHFLQRYFSPGYLLNVAGTQHNDLCILIHSNKICVITLAKSHYLLNSGQQIIKVDFQINSTTNRMENVVRGKRKHGGQFLGAATAPLCRITCSDQSTHVIQCGIRGKLIEVNRRLPELPSLLATHTLTEGYLAIVMPKLEECENISSGLLPLDKYIDSRPELSDSV